MVMPNAVRFAPTMVSLLLAWRWCSACETEAVLSLIANPGQVMTYDQMRSLIKSCGLDWHRGYMPLFDGDTTNRYVVLIEAVEASERERLALFVENWMHRRDITADDIRGA